MRNPILLPVGDSDGQPEAVLPLGWPIPLQQGSLATGAKSGHLL